MSTKDPHYMRFVTEDHPDLLGRLEAERDRRKAKGEPLPLAELVRQACEFFLKEKERKRA